MGAKRPIFGHVRSRFGECSRSLEHFRGLKSPRITSKHQNIAPTDRFDPRLYTPKNAIFDHFGGILAGFRPASGPLGGPHRRFSDTFGADLGNVLAFLRVLECLNHLRSPQNTKTSRLRTDLSPGFTPRKMPFSTILGSFWAISGKLQARSGGKNTDFWTRSEPIWGMFRLFGAS